EKICSADFSGHRLARAVLLKAQQVELLLPLVGDERPALSAGPPTRTSSGLGHFFTFVGVV
ncbi:MAG: hypothetical protein PHH77_10230, partial [Victivallaceae bacterium]|nr:hypothetical protein [Victivallaceae bacterium]